MNKIFIIMLLLFANMVNGNAQSIDTKFSYKGKISLLEFLTLVKEQSGYDVAYKQSDIKSRKKIYINEHNENQDRVLNKILKEFNLTYILDKSKRIIIKRSKETGTIKGYVKDAITLTSLTDVNIELQNMEGQVIRRGTTDSYGLFAFKDIPIGRYRIKATMVGFQPIQSTDILLASSHDSEVNLLLKENTIKLQEVVVQPSLQDYSLKNVMALAGGRSLNIEETSRFAGNFDDPIRMATSYAGIVSSNTNSNAMEIRGNSPQFAQWRMEGIETPNLTHFADMTGLGGGILTSLSTYMIDNSDFYYGTYPAEYTNSLSGIFDMKIRNGNKEKYEYALQIGIWGLGFSSEGPINRNNGSSYILNYRYSFSSIADKISGSKEGMNYQDLAFKLHFPTKRWGTFSLWGIGLTDKIRQNADEDQIKWETIGDRQDKEVNFTKGVVGLGHIIPILKDSYLKTNLGVTYSKTKAEYNIYNEGNVLQPSADVYKSETDILFNSYLNQRFNSWHTNRTGVGLTWMFYNLDYNMSPEIGLFKPIARFAYGDDKACALSLYSNSLFLIANDFKLSVGVSSQYFSLNKAWSIEPRLNMEWNFHPKHSLSFGYGLSSRRERIEYYHTKTLGHKSIDNSQLSLAKTHQLNLGYNWRITDKLKLKVEPYYQYLYNIPVEDNSSFSIINFDGFILDKSLVNKGKGRNYGIDIAMEHTMTKGWYWLFSSSIFKSEYMGGDNIWRNTRIDRRFVMKALFGKEWLLGGRQNKVLGVNFKATYQGGGRYTPIDYAASNNTHTIHTEDAMAFSLHFPSSFVSDLTINYRVKKKRVSHEFSFQLLNLNGFKNSYYQYNILNNEIEKKKGIVMVPNLRYTIYF